MFCSFTLQSSLETDLIELVSEHPSLGMFSASSDDSLLDLLNQQSIEPSPPICTPDPKSILSSTPNSVEASSVQPALSLCTPSPIVVHSTTSNSTEPSQPITSTVSALKTTTITTCSKRKALFCKEESGGSSTVAKERLPGHLPFPDRFSIRVEEAISNHDILSVRRQLICDLGSFYYALSKHPLQGDYKRIALAVCDKFPDLRDSSPSSYWVCFLNIYHLLNILLSATCMVVED